MKKCWIVVFVLCTVLSAWTLERQPNADDRARREALSKKTSGSAVLLFAPMEAEGPNAVYGFRQDDNFFYLSGWVDPGAVLLIVPTTETSGDKPARPYSEILFLAANNKVEEKWTGPKLNASDPQVTKITGFDRVEFLDKLRDEINRLLPSKLFEGSRAQVHGAIDALVRRAIKSGDIRKDLEPFDLLRALIGVSNVASSPDWQQSAKRLVDILITGSRPVK